ncbi:hypothetical protein XI01_16655 [Bradyrhizobium sp. CCBAU 21360]|nr:hypothetical protein [Bradyrhizobium sp. CCBAU 21360]
MQTRRSTADEEAFGILDHGQCQLSNCSAFMDHDFEALDQSRLGCGIANGSAVSPFERSRLL